ncbi:hypothetical protein [Halanaeroarchaeum sp. HSR-CO]|uniref:hypothetical protein n=1 Tax=Halanaeroarchaeum sp. HSR-CO TaxID=2866382 RepID=UPI00217EC3D4|nr:hypothetical protein [Halanaeroarchaeum sp. HSR-CO]
MTDYYDHVLGLIPIALFGVGGGLHVAGFALTSALVVGGLVAATLIAHAMFVNGPVRLDEMGQPTDTKQSTANHSSNPAD